MNFAATDLQARLLDAAQDAVIVANLRGRVVLMNEAATRMCGYGTADLRAGFAVADLYQRRDDARQVAARLRSRPVGTSPLDATNDVDVRASSGEIVPARLAVCFLHDASGLAVGTLGVFVDRREVRALGQRLVEVANEVEAVERRAAGITLAAKASHELSQPLTAALGQVEMLQMDPHLPSGTVERIERIASQLDRMRRILREFTRSVTAYVAPRSEGR